MTTLSLKGEAASLPVASRMTEVGLTVLKPVSDSHRFDLAIYHDSVFYRVQVKRAQKCRPSRGVLTEKFTVPVRHMIPTINGYKTHKYCSADVELLVGVVMETLSVYCFPIHEVDKVKVEVRVNPKGVPGRPYRQKFDPEMYKDTLLLGGLHITI